MEKITIGGLEIRFLQSKHTTSGSLDLFEMTVQPNARMPIAHYHESWDETIYGLDGALIFRVAGEDIVIEPGTTTFIPRGTVHGFRNDSQKPVTCLCLLTPGVIGPEYFREMADILASPPPDPVKMKETMLRYGLIPVPTE